MIAKGLAPNTARDIRNSTPWILLIIAALLYITSSSKPRPFILPQLPLAILQQPPFSPHVRPQLHRSGARCPNSTLTDDVVLVFKTGATAHDRVPAHIDTDLSCVSHIVAGSDLEEQINGLQILDVLADTDPEIQAVQPEFSFYRQLHELAGAGAPASIALTQAFDGPSKEDNRAWKLDKWKFLPLLRAAVEKHPNKNWYFFVEEDT